MSQLFLKIKTTGIATRVIAWDNLLCSPVSSKSTIWVWSQLNTVVNPRRKMQKTSMMHDIITKQLFFQKLCTWGLPKKLTPEHKTKCMGAALTFLQPCHDEDNE